jgi:sterol desaturase/sphingolipid hydroxylase (fatty acid hydroxylase superfamily)
MATKKEKLKHILSYLTWPGLVGICIALTAYGFAQDQPILYFNFSYIFLILSLFFLERYMPHEREWMRPDGQLLPDILHTITSKGTVQVLFLSAGVIGLAGLLDDPAHGIWPHAWPLWAQVILGLIIAEFPLYWAHRLGHTWKPFWRFHAIHHSVTKLWFVNTGRFHFIDSLVKIVGSMALLIAFGAPMEVIKWISAITAFIGMLTHCNVEMRFGPLSWIFNTPELHRWHHSKDLREGDKNFCENIMIWDHVFRTYFREPWRRPPLDIGLKEGYMPPKFTHQLIWPFLPEGVKRQVDSQHKQ